MKQVVVPPMHEFNSTGQHRIVVIKPDGTTDSSDWVEVRDLAVHGNLRANANPDLPLPSGIFTTSERAHTVLT